MLRWWTVILEAWRINDLDWCLGAASEPVPRREPSAAILDALKKIRGFYALGDNEVPHRKALGFAEDLLYDCHTSGIPGPGAVLSGTSGIGLTWARASVTVYHNRVGFDDGGRASPFSYEDYSFSVERAIRELQEALA